MKKLLSFLLVTLLVVASIPASVFPVLAAERSYVSVEAPSEILYTGDSEKDSFTVSFALTLASDVSGVAGYEIVLQWESDVLALADTVSVKSTGIHTVNLDNAASGSAKIVVANATDMIGEGTLFDAVFYPLTDNIDTTVTATVQRLSTASGFIPCDGGEATVSVIPLPPVSIDVSEHAILTDGVTDYAEDWNDASAEKAVLIGNSNCTKTDMDVELLFPIGKTIFIDSISLYFYHCPEAMIGYPEGKATFYVSTDGEHFSSVGSFAFADAGLVVGKYGTVKNTFAFATAEAAYIKVCFSVGSSTEVLGNTPADGKIFWEYVALTEMTYSRYCEHQYTVTSSQEATCTASGMKIYTCKECGDTYSEAISALGHTESDWIESVPATCTATGSCYRECTVCKVVLKSETIAALGHTIGDWETTKEATCNTTGTRARICSVCGFVSATETVAMTDHISGEPTIERAPTCTASGRQSFYCIYCNFFIKRETVPAKGHTYDDETVTLSPTCEAAGVKALVCVDCGYATTETIPALGHSEGELLSKDATCTEAGYRKQSCTVCEKSLLDETFPALGHSYDGGVTNVQPSCENAGNILFTCDTCGHSYNEPVPALGHTEGEWETVKDATGDQQGERVKKCKVCQQELDRETIPAITHEYDDGVITLAPTCDSAGSKTFTCKTCGDFYTVTIPATGHTEGELLTKDATCTETGYRKQFCTVCEKPILDETIPLTEHSYVGDTEIIENATCTENGILALLCENCKEQISTAEIPAKGHSYDGGETVTQPSCEGEGVKKYSCVNCGYSYTEQISANGHTEGDWSTVREPSCTEAGLKEKICTVCKEVLSSKSITALGHTEGDWETAKEVTCTESGTREKKCTVCGEVLASEVIPMLGHQAGDAEISKNATCTENGTVVTRCVLCGETLSSEETPALGHQAGEWKPDKAATCTEDGTNVKTCTVCGEVLEQQPVSAVGHIYDNGTVTVEPTCDTEGTRTFQCENCDASYQKAIAAVGHTVGEWEHAEDATCTEDGANVKKCSVCGQVLETELLPALGHSASDWKTVKEATLTENGEKAKVCTVCGETVATAGIPKHVAVAPADDTDPKNIKDLWGTGDATEKNITLIVNPDPDLTGMDITLLQEFDEPRMINGVTLYLYHCAEALIGYPEGTATVLVSADGISYSPVGTFALAKAELSVGKAGTVASEFLFETAVKATAVKILLHAGDNTGVLGPSPADGKIYWEFIGVVSLEVSEMGEDWVKGDVDGNGIFDAKDYMKLKRHILGTFALDEAALPRSDVNLDGTVSAKDYLMLKRICLGTMDFPVA